jgi:hypothetical protein
MDKKTILNTVKETFGSQVVKKKKVMALFEKDIKNGVFPLKYTHQLWNPKYKVSHGYYRYDVDESKVSEKKIAVEKKPASTKLNLASGVTAIGDSEVFIPEKDETYVRWGQASVIEKIIRSGAFFPVFISGFSGNGKTFMVEQACANAKRAYVRVQVTPETDEDDLIGGFRLIDGNTVFEKGPVVRAMESGAVLLIDEIDRATNKIMALQGVLEGKPIMLKKIGSMVHPAPGFNVIATGNTKGNGSEDGRYSAAGIIDEALLERFVINIEQEFPTKAIELKILEKHAEKFGLESYGKLLEEMSLWADIIRKTFNEGNLEDFISTRRLCHIIQTCSVLGDVKKSIELCVNRFDSDTKEAFITFFDKITNNDESIRQMVEDSNQNAKEDHPF